MVLVAGTAATKVGRKRCGGIGEKEEGVSLDIKQINQGVQR